MDLAAVSVVDNHCHALLREPVRDRGRFRSLFAEANSPSFAPFVPAMAYYQATLIELSRELGVPADEEAVLATRATKDHETWIARLLRGAHFSALLVDDGIPPPADCYTREELARLAGCAVGHVWRLEVAAQDLIREHAHFDDLMTAWRAGLQDLRKRRIVSLKSIAAYRTGLNIEPPNELGARAGFAAARETVAREGRVRLADKPLLEYLLHEALAEASRQEVPIQFHTGYGDPDTDLRYGNPLHLRLILDDPRYQGAPLVLLHESYPFTREAAFLASVYPHVFMDLSFAVPMIGWTELLSCTRSALAVAPYTKLMHSSDGHSIPEHAWMGARRGREIVAMTVDEMVSNHELLPGTAEDAAAAILRDNAWRVYRLDNSVLVRPQSGPDM